jgi:uncharacterized membrane protein YGL010W
MMGGKTWDEWISEYSKSHEHPVNKLTHKIGIPMIAVSLPLFLVAPFITGFWIIPTLLFVIGWIFQFVGHAFERKAPEFFKDWRFLFVGLRWWLKKMRG